MKTCILIANEEEASYLQTLALKKNIQIIITGEGRTPTISTLAKKLKDNSIQPDDTLINIGYVGANGYKKEDIVQIQNVAPLFPSKTINEPALQLRTISSHYQTADCYTADNFVHKEDINSNLKCVIDMELYYIALMFPNVFSIKVVSDELNYNDYKQADFKKSWETVNTILNLFIP